MIRLTTFVLASDIPIEYRQVLSVIRAYVATHGETPCQKEVVRLIGERIVGASKRDGRSWHEAGILLAMVAEDLDMIEIPGGYQRRFAKKSECRAKPDHVPMETVP